MQFHYVVIYDSASKTWAVEDGAVEAYFPDGTVWDWDTHKWLHPDPDNFPEVAAIDERAYTMIRTLATIWPEVDHGAY